MNLSRQTKLPFSSTIFLAKVCLERLLNEESAQYFA